MNREITSIISSSGTCIRAKELKEQGLSPYQINKLVEQEVLVKIYQGVYQLVNSEKIQITDINVIVENGIISMTSASFYYKLSEKDSGKITVTLDRNQKPPKMPYDLFSYYYTTSNLYKLGLNIIDQDGRKIKIYDRERTVCDIIKHRSKYDEEFILEVVSNYMISPEKDMKKLMEYANELRVQNPLMECITKIGGYYVEAQK